MSKCGFQPRIGRPFEFRDNKVVNFPMQDDVPYYVDRCRGALDHVEK
jgi:hypothetical protein